MIKKTQLKLVIKICLCFSFLFACSQKVEEEEKYNENQINKDTIIGDVHIIHRNDSIIQFLMSPDRKDRMHQIVNDTLGNVLFDEGSYFSVSFEESSRVSFEVVLNSIKYPKTSKNFAAFGVSSNSEDELFNIGQWHSDSYRDTFLFSIPDTLIGKIDFLQFCIGYFSSKEEGEVELKVDECSVLYSLEEGKEIK